MGKAKSCLMDKECYYSTMTRRLGILVFSVALFCAGESSWAQVEKIRYEPRVQWQKTGIYLSLRGGAFLHHDSSSIYGDIVGAGGAAVGLLLSFGESRRVPLSSMRLELEGSYIAQKNVGRTQNSRVHRWKASGYMLLSSLFFDLRTEHALKPYVMLSGGYREPSLTLTQGNSPIFHDRSGLLGGGGGVGVSLNEDDSIILDMDYRYLHNLKEDGVGTSHMTFIGVRFLDL